MKYKGGTTSDEIRNKIKKEEATNILKKQLAIGKLQSLTKKRITTRKNKQTNLATELRKTAATYKNTLKKLDFKGAIIDNLTLSNKPLNNLNLQNIKIINSKLNNTKFIGSNLKGALFKNNEMNNTDFTNTNLENTTFNDIVAGKFNPNFSSINIKGATFVKTLVSLKDLILNLSSKLSIFEKVNFKNLGLKPSIIHDFSMIECGFKKVTFNNNKFFDGNFLKCILLDNPFVKCNIQKCNFKYCIIENNRFNECVFRECNFINIRTNMSIYCFNSYFDDTNFQETDIKNSKFDYCRLINCKFNNVSFENSTFNGCTLDSDLTGLNLRGSQFIPLEINFTTDRQIFPAEFGPNVIFRDTLLEGAVFQETNGLEDRNFDNIRFVGASFHGCSLINSTFRNADLRNADITNCVITDCDFTGALIDGINIDDFTLNTGDDNNGLNSRLKNLDIPKIYPSDIHAAFSLVNINLLYDLLSTGDESRLKTAPNEFLVTFIKNELTNMINNIKPEFNDSESRDKNNELISKLLEYLDLCLRTRLQTYDFNTIIRNTEPPIMWKIIIFLIINYVTVQNNIFIENYVKSLLIESATTYGTDGVSCQRGILERIVIKLRDAILLSRDMLYQDKNYEKIVTYNTLLNIIDPTQKSETDIDKIRLGKDSDTNMYFEVDQDMRDEWRRMYINDQDVNYSEEDDLNAILDGYREFLKHKFKYDNLLDKQKNVLDDVINTEVNNMRFVLEYDDEYFKDQQGSGNRKYSKYILILKNKNLFNKLFNKLIKNKTKSKNKNKNKTKKINKKLNKKLNKKVSKKVSKKVKKNKKL